MSLSFVRVAAWCLHSIAQRSLLKVLQCSKGASGWVAWVQQQEQSALSIARALGYEQIAAALERTTTVQAAPMQAGQELRAVSPEVMQEAYMSDDDEDAEGGTSLPHLTHTHTHTHLWYTHFQTQPAARWLCLRLSTLPYVLVFERSLLIAYRPPPRLDEEPFSTSALNQPNYPISKLNGAYISLLVRGLSSCSCFSTLSPI